jgi:hypothetical protein
VGTLTLSSITSLVHFKILFVEHLPTFHCTIRKNTPNHIQEIAFHLQACSTAAPPPAAGRHPFAHAAQLPAVAGPPSLQPLPLKQASALPATGLVPMYHLVQLAWVPPAQLCIAASNSHNPMLLLPLTAQMGSRSIQSVSAYARPRPRGRI